jgi:hypothetical protein
MYLICVTLNLFNLSILLFLFLFLTCFLFSFLKNRELGKTENFYYQKKRYFLKKKKKTKNLRMVNISQGTLQLFLTLLWGLVN